MDYLLQFQFCISGEWGDWLHFCIVSWFKMLQKEFTFECGTCYYDIRKMTTEIAKGLSKMLFALVAIIPQNLLSLRWSLNERCSTSCWLSFVVSFSVRAVSPISQATTWKELTVYRLGPRLLALTYFFLLYFFLIKAFLATYFSTNSFIPLLAVSHPPDFVLGTISLPLSYDSVTGPWQPCIKS